MKGLVNYINEGAETTRAYNELNRIIQDAELEPGGCPDAEYFDDLYPTAEIDVNELEKAMTEMLSNKKDCYVVEGGRGGEDISYDINDAVIENVQLDMIYENENEFFMEYTDFGKFAVGCASYEESCMWMIFI